VCFCGVSRAVLDGEGAVQRIRAWLAPAALLWIVGAHGPDARRLACWGLALVLECGSPWWGFRTPGLGCSTTADRDVEGVHMVGLAGLAALAGVAAWATPLLLSIGSTTVLVVVAVWEWWSVGRQASEPSAVTPSLPTSSTLRVMPDTLRA
jgi:low temperature requirement protein LtrA